MKKIISLIVDLFWPKKDKIAYKNEFIGLPKEEDLPPIVEIIVTALVVIAAIVIAYLEIKGVISYG